MSCEKTSWDMKYDQAFTSNTTNGPHSFQAKKAFANDKFNDDL